MKSTRHGMTVIELLLALGLLAITMISLMGAFSAGLELIGSSTDITAATEVGRTFMERTKKLGYSATAPGVYSSYNGDPPDPGTGFPPAPYPLVTLNNQRLYLVVECLDVGVTARQITVDVHWTPRSKIRLSTLVHI